MKRKALLWITTALALAAPAVTLGIRARDGRTADALVVRGLAALDAPLERAARPESIDWRTAVDSFERARTLDPGGASGQRASAMFHVARAYEFLSRAEVVMAHTEATTAARMLGDDPRVKLCLALTTLRRGDPARAERAKQGIDAVLRVAYLALAPLPRREHEITRKARAWLLPMSIAMVLVVFTLMAAQGLHQPSLASPWVLGAEVVGALVVPWQKLFARDE
mgnify:CR=1 FL=1